MLEIISQKVHQILSMNDKESYILIKEIETSIELNSFKLDKNEIGLELGCGNGLQSILLSGLNKLVISTDLERPNLATHSIGILDAKKTIQTSNINNIKLISCSAEKLPFKENTFDWVFSSSVLEHIKNKDLALKEMWKVLKPGGRCLTVVPTYIQALLQFLHFPLYILKRIISIVLKRKDENIDKNSDPQNNKSLLKRFFDNHPSFPLPEPHGTYNSVFGEIWKQFQFNWLHIIKKQKFQIIDTFAVLFLPYNILEIFSLSSLAKIYKFTKKLHIFFSHTWFQYFSYGWCIVAKKHV